MCIYSVTHLKVRSAALFTVDAAVSGHVDLMSWRPFPSRNSELMGLFFPLARGWELRVECSINWSTIHIIIFLIEGLNRKTIDRTFFFFWGLIFCLKIHTWWMWKKEQRLWPIILKISGNFVTALFIILTIEIRQGGQKITLPPGAVPVLIEMNFVRLA